MNDDPSPGRKASAEGISFEGIEGTEPGKQPVVFRYRRPEVLKRNHGIASLVRSDILFSAVQLITEGGENSLHSHSALDGFWFVLGGRARFYGAGDQVIGEIGKHEGVFVPRNVPYWFESVGDELLELLQVEAIDKTVKNTLTRHAPRKLDAIEMFDSEGAALGTMGEGG